MRWKGPDALAVCRAHRCLPVGILLLRYSVLFTVEFLSLLYLHFYLDLYVLGDDALVNKGYFTKPNTYVSWSTSELRVRVAFEPA